MNDHDEEREREGEVCIEGEGGAAAVGPLSDSAFRSIDRVMDLLQQIGRLAARFNVAPIYLPLGM